MESTRKPFYRLDDRSSGELHLVYGQPEWERKFGPAEWSMKVGGLSTGRLCPPFGEPRVDLTIILPSPRIGDFVWTWYSDCIVTESTLSLFREAGFTGFSVHPVTIERVKRLPRKRAEEVIVPPLYELAITGRGGDAAPESGIYPLYEIKNSRRFQYSSFRNGIIIDEANWDGSDFCTINGYTRFILVAERVKDLIIGHQLTNCGLIPSEKLEWRSGLRPEDELEETRAMASRPLESLLADLEKSDVSHTTIYVIGYKGDPRAVDPLIVKFDNPDHSIWNSAAGAVANIVQNKETPEHVREEIFSKLRGLLSHDDPYVRRTAAAAFGHIGGERACQVVMGLFEDPDELVRDRAVFIMGVLRYKPALEAVRRLTRDRSKEVRKTARLVLPELMAECP